MKSMNISSATGRSPPVAAPMAAPMNADSEIGVSSTRPGNLPVEALGDAEDASPGVVLAGRARAAGVVLAHDDHALVAFHLLGDRLVDRLAVGDAACHFCGPSLSTRRRRR